MTAMTLAKAIVVVKAGLAAAAAALALTACGPAPAGVASAALTAAPTAPRVLPAATTRRLLQAATASATLWGLDYRVSYHRTGYREVRTPQWTEMRRGRLFWHRAETRDVFVDYGWVTDMTFSGDGEAEDLTGGRFLYTVPDGRVLIVNRVVAPGRVTLNGYALDGIAGDDVHFVFGPGEAVVIGFPTGSDGSDRSRCAAKVHGFTADPALLGGAGLGSAAAK